MMQITEDEYRQLCDFAWRTKEWEDGLGRGDMLAIMQRVQDRVTQTAQNSRAERILCAMIAAGKSPVDVIDAQTLANRAVVMAMVIEATPQPMKGDKHEQIRRRRD
jgi:hypothetical protein